MVVFIIVKIGVNNKKVKSRYLHNTKRTRLLKLYIENVLSGEIVLEKISTVKGGHRTI